MDCVELRKNLLLYVDNELSLEETRNFRHHLDICAACRRRAEYEERFRNMLRERLSPLPAPPGLKNRIRARLAEEDRSTASVWRKARSWVRLSRPSLAAGVAGLLALVVALPFLTSQITSVSDEAGIEAHFRGHLVCLQCDKMGASLEQQKKCRTYGHQVGLKTGEGELLSFADTEDAAQLLSDPELRGREVEVEGMYYSKIATLEVHSHTLL